MVNPSSSYTTRLDQRINVFYIDLEAQCCDLCLQLDLLTCSPSFEQVASYLSSTLFEPVAIWFDMVVEAYGRGVLRGSSTHVCALIYICRRLLLNLLAVCIGQSAVTSYSMSCSYSECSLLFLKSDISE